MSKSKIFIGIAVSFAAGILLASAFRLPREGVYILLALSAAAVALSFSARFKWLPLAALFLFMAAAGALRLQVSQVANQYASFFDSKQQLEGYIVEDADIRTNEQLLTVRPKNFSQNILVTAPLGRDYFYGDWVYIDGKLVEPQNFSDFDYQGYLERFNTYALVRYPKILVLKSHQLSFVKEQLLRLKAAFVNRAAALLNEPQGSLLLGILIGAKKTLPQNVIDNFNATGTSHIIAISGFNITIIIAALGFLARFFGRKASLWLSLIIIFAFVILSGASASVIRAAIMGSLLLTSFNLGRQYALGPALFFAAFVMLLINPKILFWDVGFQLSFLATLGIIYFVPLLEQATQSWPNPWEIKNIFLVTIAATFVTLPLILFQFGRLSLIAPLANILILPLLPVVMLIGFLIILPWIGAGFAFLANIALVYILRVVAILASIPYSSLAFHISNWLFLILAVLVAACYFLLKRMAWRQRRLPVRVNENL